MAKESDTEKYLVERVKALGGEVRKVKWIGRKSAPDRVVWLPVRHGRVMKLSGPDRGKIVDGLVGPTQVWVELKAPGKEATFPADAHERAQHREHERMRKFGQVVVVVDSLAGVDEVLR